MPELHVGDIAWYALRDRRARDDRRVRTLDLVRVEVVRIGRRRASIRLLDFSDDWRVRSVGVDKLVVF